MMSLFFENFCALFRKRMRTFLTIGGIAIGVLSVVVISGIGQIGRSMVDNTLNRMGMNGIIVSSDEPLKEPALAAISRLPNIERAMPLMSRYTEAQLFQDTLPCMLWGVNQDANYVIALDIVTGRLINKSDLYSNAEVCVIDDQLAIDTFGTTHVVGKTISINTGRSFTPLKIVGVVQNGVNLLQSMSSGAIPSFVYMPYTTLMQCSGETSFDTIVTRLISQDLSPESEDAISRVLTQENIINNVSVKNLLQQKDQFNQIMEIITLILSVIAGISLIVSGLSIMTVMMVSVNERTREIYIKKSIGATNRDIMLEFLFESTVLSLIGGLIGVVVGISLVFFGATITGIEFRPDWISLLQTLGFSGLVGLIFGMYPAYTAAKRAVSV